MHARALSMCGCQAQPAVSLRSSGDERGWGVLSQAVLCTATAGAARLCAAPPAWICGVALKNDESSEGRATCDCEVP